MYNEIQKQFLMALILPNQNTNNFIYEEQPDKDGFKFTFKHKTKKNVDLQGGYYNNQKNNYVHVNILAFLEEPDIDELVEFIKNDFFQFMKGADAIKQIIEDKK